MKKKIERASAVSNTHYQTQLEDYKKIISSYQEEISVLKHQLSHQ